MKLTMRYIAKVIFVIFVIPKFTFANDVLYGLDPYYDLNGLPKELISTKQAVPVSAVNGIWTPTGSMNTARALHSVTLLSNGKALVAGGLGVTSDILVSAELYDPKRGTWTPTGSLNTARTIHTSTLLKNGRILVVGGEDMSGNRIASAELYDPSSGIWTSTGSMHTARSEHTATLLPNGQVLVAGGGNGNGVHYASAELYDPQSGVWTFTGGMATGRNKHIATLLNNGQVLVSGGNDSNSDDAIANAELYDPEHGTWIPTGSMATARAHHTATLLNNGQVLVVGGCNGWNCSEPDIDNPRPSLASTELYDPVSGAWSNTGSLTTGRKYHTEILLNNGHVLVVGGDYWDGNIRKFPTNTELYNPKSGMWVLSTAHISPSTLLGPSTLLPNSQVLAAGEAQYNDGNWQILASAKLYQQPDLIISSIVLNPIGPAAGNTFTAAVTVKNQGINVSNAGTLSIWMNQSKTQKCGATGDKSVAVGCGIARCWQAKNCDV